VVGSIGLGGSASDSTVAPITAMATCDRVHARPPCAPPNPRMQPTGRTGAGLRLGGTFRWSLQRKRWFVRAGMIACS
jgi:hypothetical protein